MKFEDIMLAMKMDAHDVNRRLGEVMRPRGGASGWAGNERKRGRDGKPLCSHCGGPVGRDKHGHYRKTCSAECLAARRTMPKNFRRVTDRSDR